MRSLRKLLYTTLLMGTLFVGVSCEDLAFGDKFLQKPPSSDVTIDTIFSTSEYARRILWKIINIFLMEWKLQVIGRKCGWGLLKV